MSPALRNGLQSALLLGAMALLWGLLGWLLAGASFMFMLLIGGVLSMLAGVRVSSTLVLGLYGAQPLSPQQAPQLHALLSELAHQAGLARVPALFHVPSRVRNAFTVGSRQNATVVLTDGLARALNWRELQGVLAHEISHVRHKDLWVMALADVVSRMTHLLALLGWLMLLLNLPLLLLDGVGIPWTVLLVMLVAPSVSALLQLALSRQREYAADLGAVALTGDPEGLASALRRLDGSQAGWWSRVLVPGYRSSDPSLLRSHPPTEQRVDRLQALANRRSTFDFVQTPDTSVDTLRGVPRASQAPRWRWLGGRYW